MLLNIKKLHKFLINLSQKHSKNHYAGFENMPPLGLMMRLKLILKAHRGFFT